MQHTRDGWGLEQRILRHGEMIITISKIAPEHRPERCNGTQDAEAEHRRRQPWR